MWGEQGGCTRYHRGEFPLCYRVLCKYPKSCLSVGPDPASILHSKGDQPVATTVGGRHKVGGVLVSLEFLVLHMFGRKSWDDCHLRQDRVPVNSGYDPIND
jgi:hypothetical protein